jgi:hypothetical protein
MRIVAGVVVMLLIVYGLGGVLGIGPVAASSADAASPQFAAALFALLAAACGGFIARRAAFAPLAVVAYALLWGLAIYYLLRLPVGLTFSAVVASNAKPILISLVAVAVGALFGSSLAKPRVAKPASAE